ncbi:RNB domain-containing ribonuclease [Massilia sp. W12]|uniref:ribonuclease catalytic domain-containing protein n=1 Tax=Massilia sp. W12 TaxID=3126507 RepID=UPI0030D2DB47
MNVFFEESGDFKVGVVLSQAGESYQVELASGKRSKVKARDVLLQYASPAPAEMLQQAQQLSEEIDLDFVWEVAGAEEFNFADLAKEYFGEPLSAVQLGALLLRLHGAPMYFYRKGRGVYKPAPEAALQAALAGIEKKKQQAAQQAQWVEQMAQGVLPDNFRPLVKYLLCKPDKNSMEYKALEQACAQLQTAPARLMLRLGGLADAKSLHDARFMLDHFPKGAGFPALELPPPPAQLPLAEVQAFSIDDATTTEIDDAFSVTALEDGRWQVGIHIAAPGLCIRPGDPIDVVARQRLSTVYMPGDKITMLPDAVVQEYTLGEGQARAALSLYAVLDAQGQLENCFSRAERVPMAANLRHQDLDELVSEQALNEGSGDFPFRREFDVLWRWAQQLEAQRMAKRAAFGLRPESNNRVDFNFYVEDGVVSIVRRKRGAPLDKIVAELMIFANSTWGKLMAEHGVPGIYRCQQAGWGGKMQVRMLTHAAPHQGLGVDQYAWSTSPLRRYTDLVNQWQILACLQHGVAAPLAAPFKQRDANLFAIVSAFDAAYAAYAEYQQTMERYWCLRWLAQQQARQVEAVVLKDEVLRLVEIPLILRLPGMPQLARGAQVRLDVIDWDELDLSVQARLLEVHGVSEDLGEEEEEVESAAPEQVAADAAPEAAPAASPEQAAQDDAGNANEQALA